MEIWIILIIVAVALVIAELSTQAVWTLCMAIGCVVGAAAGICGASAGIQIALIPIASIVGYMMLIPWLNKWQRRARQRAGMKGATGMDALIGRTAIVTEPLYPGRLGRARIDGDYWQVQVPGLEHTIYKDEKLLITGYDSIILNATPITEAAPVV